MEFINFISHFIAWLKLKVFKINKIRKLAYKMGILKGAALQEIPKYIKKYFIAAT